MGEKKSIVLGIVPEEVDTEWGRSDLEEVVLLKNGL